MEDAISLTCNDFHCCECGEFALHSRDSCYYKINSTFLIVAFFMVVRFSFIVDYCGQKD